MVIKEIVKTQGAKSARFDIFFYDSAEVHNLHHKCQESVAEECDLEIQQKNENHDVWVKF